MSEHDPFDGIYDGNPPAAAVEAERQKPDAPREKPADATTYSAPFLRRQDKDDLQAIARKRGLDSSGTRDQLVDRILESQRS